MPLNGNDTLTVKALASSSKGNSYVVTGGGCALLVDCGLTYCDFVRRLGALSPNLMPGSFLGVLVTHSHIDHVQGLEVFAKRCPEVPVFANAMTAEVLVAKYHVREESIVCFENGQPFVVGDFEVQAFSVPHDTSDPVGYLVRGGSDTYFHATDIGTPLDSIGVKLSEADVATLESNHDAVMLRRSNRPPSLIQRIAGPSGHLSNDQAALLVERFARPRLRQLNLAHLSHDCNTPEIAESVMRNALNGIDRGDVELRIF